MVTITSPGIDFPLSSVTLNGMVMMSPLLTVTSSTLTTGVTLVMLSVDLPAALSSPLSNNASIK